MGALGTAIALVATDLLVQFGLLALTVIRQTLQRPIRHVVFLALLMALVTAFGWALGLAISSVVSRTVSWTGLPRFVAECILWLAVMARAAAPLQSGRLRDRLTDMIPS